MKNTFNFIFAFLVFITFISHNHAQEIYNVPAEGIMPKFTKRGDLEFSTSFVNYLFEDGSDRYINAQVSYSPIKYLGISIGHFRYEKEMKTSMHLTSFSLGGMHW